MSEVLVPNTDEPMYVLESIDAPTTLETCDACGPAVIALVRVILLSGASLTFCGHHGQQFGYTHAVPDSKLQGSAN